MEEQILAMSYWENFKFDKELAQSLPSNHPKRILQHKETEKILLQWNDLKLKNQSQ